jgi:magnesium-transporting ATPase (P-type)
LVKIPTYYEYMFELFFLQPFSYTQYFYFTVFLLLKMPLYGVLLIVGSFITSTVNYIFIRISYLKIKKIAEKRHEVEVIRQGAWKTIESSLLVPGDLFRPG